jgi:hypothetical protein
MTQPLRPAKFAVDLKRGKTEEAMPVLSEALGMVEEIGVRNTRRGCISSRGSCCAGAALTATWKPSETSAPLGRRVRLRSSTAIWRRSAITSNTSAVQVRSIAMNAGYPQAIENTNESAWIKFWEATGRWFSIDRRHAPHPATFAKRSVSGNTVLMARLTKALTVAAILEFKSKRDVEKALRKLIGAADAE